LDTIASPGANQNSGGSADLPNAPLQQNSTTAMLELRELQVSFAAGQGRQGAFAGSARSFSRPGQLLNISA
jgi:hypothetical protein